jgi:hypothetical protein
MLEGPIGRSAISVELAEVVAIADGGVFSAM